MVNSNNDFRKKQQTNANEDLLESKFGQNTQGGVVIPLNQIQERMPQILNEQADMRQLDAAPNQKPTITTNKFGIK